MQFFLFCFGCKLGAIRKRRRGDLFTGSCKLNTYIGDCECSNQKLARLKRVNLKLMVEKLKLLLTFIQLTKANLNIVVANVN